MMETKTPAGPRQRALCAGSNMAPVTEFGRDSAAHSNRMCDDCGSPVPDGWGPNSVRFYCDRCDRLTVIVVPVARLAFDEGQGR